MQAAYEEFGCNAGNVFFMGIDKGNTTSDVILFDSLYGIEYPSVAGQDGGGNAVHWDYNIQGTPTLVVITPDKLIATHQVYPPNTANVVDSVLAAGGIQQSCMTTVHNRFTTTVSVDLAPNPAKETASLILHNIEEIIVSVTVINSNGQVLADFPEALYQAGSHAFKMNLSNFPVGLYFVRVKEKNQTILTRKLSIIK